MNARLAVIASVLLFAAIAHAQVTERIDVRVVNVDVTVTSKGVPVSGLTRDDFEVFEDGKRQAVSNFYTSEETRISVKKTPSVEASADVPQPDERFRRRMLVLVDNN